MSDKIELPPEVEAAIATAVDGAGRAGEAAALKHAHLITEAPFWTVPILRTAIATALANARESGRRDVLDAQVSAIAAGVVADVRDGLSVTKAMAAFVDAIEREQRGEQIDGDPVTDLTSAIKRSQDAAEARGREAGRREVLEGTLAIDEAMDALWKIMECDHHDECHFERANHAHSKGYRGYPGERDDCDCRVAEVLASTLAAIAADKARAVEGMRPVLPREDAVRLIDAYDSEQAENMRYCPGDGDSAARAAILAALTGAKP